MLFWMSTTSSTKAVPFLSPCSISLVLLGYCTGRYYVLAVLFSLYIALDTIWLRQSSGNALATLWQCSDRYYVLAVLFPLYIALDTIWLWQCAGNALQCSGNALTMLWQCSSCSGFTRLSLTHMCCCILTDQSDLLLLGSCSGFCCTFYT